MIACVVDTVATDPEVDGAKLVVFINTKARATRHYSKCKKKAKNYVELRIDGNVTLSESDLITFYAHVASYFAEYKERIVVYEGDRVVVFAKGVGPLG